MRRFLLALSCVLLSVALLPPAGAVAQDGADGDDETTTGVSEPVYEDSVTESYTVETEHGTLYGEVIRPVTADGEDVEVPVILTYSPYNVITFAATGGGSIADDATADYFVSRGYARAVFDLVGTRKSSGCYDYGGIAERETGAALVEFLAEQPWSTGKVGMIGGSYNGTTAIAAAVEDPPHLTTIVPQVAIDRWYDYAFGGGIRYFLNNENPTDEGFDTPLAFDFGFGFLPPADVSDPEQWAAATGDHIQPCDKIEHTERAYETDPVYDEFWEERDYRRRAANVTASVLIEGAWLDHNVKHWDSTRFFLALPDDHPKKLVMGQWNHAASQFEDAQDIRHAWFDHWLLGLDTGVMDLPAVDTQLNTQAGTDAREQEPSWPPRGTSAVDLALTPPAEDEPAKGDLATDQTPNDDGDALFTDQPGAPVSEEEMFASSGSDSDGRFVKFESVPLSEAVRISGGPVLDIRLHSTGMGGDGSFHFTPVLYDVAPDGSVSVITRGFLNGRNRNGLDVSEPVPAGDPYRAPIPLWDTDYLVEAGHRIGVVLSADNADWALDDPDGGGETAVDLAQDDGDLSSVLRLPVSAGHTALGAVPSAPSTGPSGACDPLHVPDPGFGDVAKSLHRANIRCIAWYAITEGRGDTDGDGANDYDPEVRVSRAQMASYLMRLAIEGGIDVDRGAPDAFEDDGGSVHETAINALADLGIVQGTGDTDGDGRREYSPGGVVSRAQMASFIARTHERIAGSLPGDPPDAFDDDDGSAHERAINQLAELGIVRGRVDHSDADGDGDTDERVYHPQDHIVRSTLATFLAADLRLFVDAGHAHPGGASVALNDTSAPAGGDLTGQVTSHKEIKNLFADGCGGADDVVEVADDGSFSVTVGEDESGECTLTLTAVTRRPGAASGATQLVDYRFDITVEG